MTKQIFCLKETMKQTTSITCDIEFDNEAKTYQSGTVVGANIKLTFNAPTKCRCE